MRLRAAILFLSEFVLALFGSSILPVMGHTQTSAIEAQSDPAALASLRHSLMLMGGSQQWSSTTCIVMDGEMVPADEKHPKQTIHWEDEWKTGYRFRREAKGSTGTSLRLGDTESGSSLQSPSKTTVLPAKTDENAVPVQIPGAMFSIALADKRYVIQFASDAMGQDSFVHIRVLRKRANSYLPAVQQDWYLNKNTSMPDHVIYRLTDLKSKTQIITEQINFLAYQPFSGLLVPVSLALIGPSRSTARTTLTFSSVTFPQSISPAHFRGAIN